MGLQLLKIADQIIEVEKDNGIHILPKTKHRIRNDKSENLEFIVISHPTTRGDRINESFSDEIPLNLNGRKLKPILNGEFKTGKCKSTIEVVNNKIRLKEEWEWTCDDYSKGKSELEEIGANTNKKYT